MGQPRYEMKIGGFLGRIKKTEVVIMYDNKYGVANVRTDDGREDFVHVEDILRVREDA